jgi:NAD(P)-dependent dehydrogenase (short-subunit alcohol dehydrogenase family)
MTNTARELTGKIAVITGASRGIGRATALRLAEEGAIVAIHFAKEEKAAHQTVKAIQADGGDAFAVQAELSALTGINSLFEQLDRELTQRTGSNQFDILVNNAAIAPASGLESTDEETFDQLFRVNMKAPFFLTQQAVQRIRENGRIINVSAILTRIGNPGTLAYAMTKGAIDIFTLNLAKQLGQKGITVNAVAPGATRTDMNPNLKTEEGRQAITAGTALGRYGEASDIAGVVAFLASDDSRWVTGQTIEASGGYSL